MKTSFSFWMTWTSPFLLGATLGCQTTVTSDDEGAGGSPDPSTTGPGGPSSTSSSAGPACETLADTASLAGSPATITVENQLAEPIVIMTGGCASDPIHLDGERLTTDWASWRCEDVPTCGGLPIPLDCHYMANVEITIAPGTSHDFPWSGIARKPIDVPTTCAPCSDAPPLNLCELAYVPDTGPHELSITYLRGEERTVMEAKSTVTLPSGTLVIPVTSP